MQELGCVIRRASVTLLILSLVVAAPAQSKDIDPALLGKANAGDAKSQFSIGLLSDLNALMAQKDGAQAAVLHRKAIEWYRKAAEQGYVPAQIELGDIYLNGKDIPKDLAQAATWYRMAAKQGDPRAQYNLGLLYHDGKGVPQDHAQAAEWDRKAAEQGDAKAEFNLAIDYSIGEGVPQDYAQAATWLRKAADQGLAPAQYNLGAAYFNGHGVPQSYAESYFWADLAAAVPKGTDEEKYVKARNLAAAKLSSSELTKAQERATKWFTEHQSQSQ